MAGGLPLANETVSEGVVDEADYQAWQENFGATAEGQGGGEGGVPEPSSVVIAAALAAVIFGAQERSRCLRDFGRFLQE
jgi:hypothetical protein